MLLIALITDLMARLAAHLPTGALFVDILDGRCGHLRAAKALKDASLKFLKLVGHVLLIHGKIKWLVKLLVGFFLSWRQFLFRLNFALFLNFHIDLVVFLIDNGFLNTVLFLLRLMGRLEKCLLARLSRFTICPNLGHRVIFVILLLESTCSVTVFSQ